MMHLNPGLSVGVIFVALSCPSPAIDFSEVRAQASALARQPFKTATNKIPESLRRLTYLEHQAIRFRSEKALWRDERLPFVVEFFHPGYFHQDSVAIHLMDGKQSKLIPFNSRAFDYGKNQLTLPEDLGFAGFRLVNLEKGFGEVAAFAGASYFRMIGRGQNYGTSARGLALNTTSAEGEEFPVFRQFWIQRPDSRAQDVSMFALLDSPSVAGAYRFVIRPGIETVSDVQAALFPRREVREFGVAPLTSMFLHGKNGRPLFTDFRPEVHDADGLLLHTGRDEWIWHPLESGKMMRVNAFTDENPRGFGLMQRERRFENYQDAVAHFERRPSVWVKPTSPWGRGAVELVQLPTDKEFQDNVVAFWVPANPVKPGESLDLKYELHWTTNSPMPPLLGTVLATRVGRVLVEPPKDPPNLRFVIDFGGASLEALTAKEKVSSEIDLGSRVELVDDALIRIEANNTWRLVIEVVDPRRAFDLRAQLRRRGKPITETWTFTWQP